MDYQAFLESKQLLHDSCGFDVDEADLNPMLFDWQRAIVRWALKKGRAALFEDCGLGKTPQQLEWAHQVCRHTGGNVLILAPLAVSAQTVREGTKFGIAVNRCYTQADVKPGINIANYERIEGFDISSFSGFVADESGILKNYAGIIRGKIIDAVQSVPFRLACTATPAPNDFMELGNHAAFCGVMTRSEMLSHFFVNDSGDTGKWRLKGHGEEKFWKWLCSFCVMLRKPSDLGYDDGAFILPPLNIYQHTIETGKALPGRLFVEEAQTLMERRGARRETISERALKAAEIANSIDGPVLVWCDLNAESEMLKRLIRGAVEVKGSDDNSHKEHAMLGFSDGEIRCLVTKPSIAGFGMNWQHCGDMLFVGLSDSYEKVYQGIRRCLRFGRFGPVNVHFITADIEGAVLENIRRKEAAANKMYDEMVKNMADISAAEIRQTTREQTKYERDLAEGDGWKLHLADCVDVAGEMADNSVGFSVFSPPFSSLYTYSNAERDMGNSKKDGEFMAHFGFLATHLYRVTQPGRICAVHCTQIPAMKERDGYIGLKDFRGDIIRLFMAQGFIFHSEHLIWKDPLIEATRTKALGLMHKQIEKDSTMCRAGLPDYLLAFRKPGENKRPVAHQRGFEDYIGEEDDTPNETGIKFSHHTWRKYASPVWMDIRQTRTLNYQVARENKDERHICPLQLDVIERALTLWSNPGDLVFSPFAGIGSEGYCALKMGRDFLGVELKRSYWEVACRNLAGAKEENKQRSLF